MIRHFVMFKLKKDFTRDSPEVGAAESMAERAGERIDAVRDWYFGRNISDRAIAYDFVIVALLDDDPGLASYLADPFHELMSRHWALVSDWVIADVRERGTDAEPHLSASHTPEET